MILELTATVLAFTTVSLAPPQEQPDPSRHKVIPLELDAAELDQIRMQCGPGGLKLTGKKKAKTVHVSAKVVVQGKGVEDIDLDQFIERWVDLTLVGGKDRNATLQSTVKSEGEESPPFPCRIDLVVTVPARMGANVQDGSGSIEVSGLESDLAIRDGSGNIKVKELVGNVTIKDGSGSIVVEGIVGDLDIEDGSGNLTFQRVVGTSTIRDGSGDIAIAEVVGDVTILADGSGGVTTRGVQGKVTRPRG